MAALLKEPEIPTAVICGNDPMALGAVHALVEAGIEVPGHISIVGAEDIPYARYANPPLTTVRIARDQLGRLAFEALHRLMRSKRRQGSEYVVETRLIVRGSSAPVSTRN
jgi:DNA-binding LacI/PurR family transcriptional regulator